MRTNGRRVRSGWCRTVVGLSFLGLAALAVCWGRNVSLPQAAALPPAAAARQEPAPVGTPSDYAQRVVAYYNGSKTITREQLGEWLMARYGAEKLELVVNTLIIEDAARQRGIEVTAAEVDASLADDLKGMNAIPLKDFITKVLKPYHKTLYEWKADVIRPRLLLTKICRERVQVTEQDFEQAWQARYGEKVDCKIIMWPAGDRNSALTQYEKIRDSDEEFDRVAKSQASSALAALGGHVKPFGRHASGNEDLEAAAFSLKPGELSTLKETREGYVVIKCVGRIPPDTSRNRDAERPALEKEIFDKKVQQEVTRAFTEMRQQAQPKLERITSDRAQQVVACYNGASTVTREQLGEWLIARYGAEHLDLLVNKQIIEDMAREKGLEITAAEVDASLAEDLKRMKDLTQSDFVAKVLKPHHKTLYEWKEDVIRPRLLLAKLCRDRVHVTEEDFQAAWEAYYGEKVDCKIILWPKNERNIALTEYEKIRESDEEFDRKAKSQASAPLAALGGHLEQPIGHHTTGNEELEKQAFALRPGELSALTETPEGYVVIKCLARKPPDSTRNRDAERSALEREIADKKVQAEIPRFFAELRDKAQPKLILRQALSEEQLIQEVRDEIKQPPVPGQPPSPTPSGN